MPFATTVQSQKGKKKERKKEGKKKKKKTIAYNPVQVPQRTAGKANHPPARIKFYF